MGQIGCAPVPVEAQVRRGLTTQMSPPSPPEHHSAAVTPAKNATPFSNLQEGLEEPVEEMVSGQFLEKSPTLLNVCCCRLHIFKAKIDINIQIWLLMSFGGLLKLIET